MSLYTYMENVQKLCRDSKQDMLDPGDIIGHINEARREVAMRSQCIRVLTPISGSIISTNLISGGLGYSANPTVTITPPDFPSGAQPFPNGNQAIANTIVNNGIIESVDVQYGGAGYWQPKITITDSTGTGAICTPNMSFINQLNAAQEAYPFSSVDLSMFPGVASIYMVRSVSLLFSNYRYSLPCYSFSVYQAKIRTYPLQYQYVPAVCSQFGQGTGGSFYMYPLPSQAYQLEFDASCLPSDLIDDQSVEAIPQPWTDAVKFYAVAMCYLELQNPNFSAGYFKLFDDFMHRYGAYVRPGRATNINGRW